MKKPKLIRRCPAAANSAEGERIVEFTFNDGTGGLMSMRKVDGRSRLEIYRTDGQVDVVAPRGALLRDPDVSRMIGAMKNVVHCIDVLGYELPFDVQDEARAALAALTEEA